MIGRPFLALYLTTVSALYASPSPRDGFGAVDAPRTSYTAPRKPQANSLQTDLDRVFDDPILSQALVAVRVESLGQAGTPARVRVIYQRNADRLVIPASNMKLVTVAVAADVLGWDYRYETTLEAIGRTADGTLDGDLIVTGSGDPAIGSPDGGHAPLFLQWADALRTAGIRRVNGRIIGDDNAFDDAGLGAGWAWDYLAAGYAAPAGALTYNENAALVRFTPAAAAGRAASVEIGPPGHALDLDSEVTTGTPGSQVDVQFLRAPGTPALTVRGLVPAGGATVVRAAAVENPTQFFVEGLRLALASRGITVSDGAWDIDAVVDPPRVGRRRIATSESLPLSSLAAHSLKVSQNLYAETILKTLGRDASRPGSTAGGRQVVERTLAAWGVPAGSIVMSDGSGLSRYNYLTASTIVAVLTHVWGSDRLRGPFVAGLPVAGRDGSLELRMRQTLLDRNVQAKTGTISNVRALSGFLETTGGEKLAFSMVANHYTAPNTAVDAVMERALERLAR